jgi:hypothetical protein
VEPFRSAKRRFGLLTRGLAVLCAAATVAAGLPAGAQAAGLQWEPTANLFWSINGSTLLGMFQNGQCTQLAANKRPDVVKTIVISSIARELQDGLGEVVPNFNARNWANLAQGAGIPTGQSPMVGALMVLQPGVMGAGPAGHIAYVKSVQRHSFTVSQMNAPIPFQVSHQRFRRSTAHQSGVRFIY